MKRNSHNGLKRSIVISICFAAFIIAFAAVEIDDVNNLDAGQFDLSFNPDVLKVVNVEDGSIAGTKIPVQWRSIDTDTVRVIFNLEGVTGISGSGQLARIGFEVIGDGERNLLISSGLLGNTEASKIDTNWGVTTATDAHQSTPGFGAVFALVGLIAVFCMVRFSRS